MAFIADPEPFILRFDPPLDLRVLADEVELLPVILDGGGCLGLRPSGEVASFLFDDPHELRVEADPRIRNTVYYRASVKYPALAAFVPPRPPDAVVCSYCGGSGQHPLAAEIGDVIGCYCGGLGWLPSESVGN